MLANKLATVMLETDRQYSCHIQRTNLKMKCLIQMLSLQAIIQSKIRLTADNLVFFRKTAFFDNLIQKAAFFDSFTRETTFFDSLNIRKKKFSILNLIKNTQEFNSLCKQIFSQLHRKSKKNLLFALIKNEILRKMNHVFVFQ